MLEKNKWEYYTTSLGSTFSGPKDEDLQAALNELGEDGWEVIAVTPIESSNKVRLVAKRLATHSTRRQRSWPE
jgi:hypothetical protein